MPKAFSVALVLVICIGCATSQAAANRVQLTERTAKELIELLTAANKEGHAPPPKTLLKQANEGFGFVTDTVSKFAVLAGTSVGICTWYHWYEWCDQTAHTNDHRPHDHE
jgi:hypothetical protein